MPFEACNPRTNLRFVLFLCLLPLLAFARQAECGLEFDGPAQVGTLTSKEILEASGLAASRVNPGAFWTHNDGSKDKLYAVTAQGELLATFDISQSVDDLEDIAIGPGPDGGDYLYIGDIGSNAATRDRVKLLRAPEPSLSGVSPDDPIISKLKGVDSFTLKYPEGTFDAEGLFVDPVKSDLYIATKLPVTTRVFRIQLSQLDSDHAVTMEFVRELDFDHVSGAAISRSGRWIALRREDFAQLWIREPGESVSDALGRPGLPIPVVGPPNELNGEAITFAADESGYFTTSEGADQNIYGFRAAIRNMPLEFAELPQLTGDGWILKARGCSGDVTVERSENLLKWTEIGTMHLGSGAGTFSDGDLAPRYFYRLRR